MATGHEGSGKTAGESILKTEQLRTVLQELTNFAQWEKLGRNLGIHQGRLDVIKADGSDNDDRLSKVIQLWLKRMHNEKECGLPTWSNLVKALTQVDKELASEIEEKYCEIKEEASSKNGAKPETDAAGSSSGLDREPTDDELEKFVAREVEKFNSLGTMLGLKQVQISMIEQEEKSIVNRNKKILTMWKEEVTREPVTWHTLIEALRDMKMKRLADHLTEKFRQ